VTIQGEVSCDCLLNAVVELSVLIESRILFIQNRTGAAWGADEASADERGAMRVRDSLTPQSAVVRLAHLVSLSLVTMRPWPLRRATEPPAAAADT
jgi:hypothetical protein